MGDPVAEDLAGLRAVGRGKLRRLEVLACDAVERGAVLRGELTLVPQAGSGWIVSAGRRALAARLSGEAASR